MISRYNYNSIIYSIMNDKEKENEEDEKETEDLNKLVQSLIKKNEILEEKLDKVLSLLNNEVVENTQKMSKHIDLIENIYNNVKSPLGYLCDKINYLKGSDKTEYAIDNKIKNRIENKTSNETHIL